MAHTMNVVGQVVLQASDGNNNAIVFSRTINPSLVDVVNSGTQYQVLTSLAVQYTLSMQNITIGYFLYIKNNSAAGNVTVSLTPSGGAAALLPILAPGGVFIYFQENNTSTPSGNGFSSVKAQGDANNMVIEYGIAGN